LLSRFAVKRQWPFRFHGGQDAGLIRVPVMKRRLASLRVEL
jgi:hypothetical protein